MVGAGLAGLDAALEFERAGVDVVVLEAADAVGGRVRTDVVDGLRLDRGFQLLNPSYPEAARVLDYDALDLRSFERGVRVVVNEVTAAESVVLADPTRLPRDIGGLARVPGGVMAATRFAIYAMRCGATPPRYMAQWDDITVAAAMAETGAGDEFLQSIIQPFLTGVFADSDLSTSRHFGDLVLRSFVRGTPCVRQPACRPSPIRWRAHSAPTGSP